MLFFNHLFSTSSSSYLFSCASLEAARPGSRIPTSIPSQITSSASKSMRVAQSQPGSRSTSPTPKYSYLTHNNNMINSPSLNSSNYENNTLINNNNNNNDLALTPNSYSTGLSKANLSARSFSSSATKSKIPTSSRNSSRESSPGRKSSKLTHIFL